MLDSGARAAYEKAVNDHFHDLYRFAYWLCRNRWQAEDLVQDALLRAWRGWADLRENGAAKVWLFTIVRREFHRSASRAPHTESLEAAESLPALEHDPTQAMDMEQALRALPQPSREALLLQVLGGFSCAEIAEALGISEGAVMTRLTRARQALRRRFEPSEEKQDKREWTALS